MGPPQRQISGGCKPWLLSGPSDQRLHNLLASATNHAWPTIQTSYSKKIFYEKATNCNLVCISVLFIEKEMHQLQERHKLVLYWRSYGLVNNYVCCLWVLTAAWAPFHETVLLGIQLRIKILLTKNQFLWNFAHGPTALLSGHVQKFVAIHIYLFPSWYNVILLGFEMREKTGLWNGALHWTGVQLPADLGHWLESPKRDNQGLALLLAVSGNDIWRCSRCFICWIEIHIVYCLLVFETLQ